MADNQIGVYEFDEMIGALLPKSKQLEVYVRPGLAGESLRNSGVRAPACLIETRHCVADRAAAKAAINAYVALKDGVGYEVFQHGEIWGYYRVFDVTPAPLVPVRSPLGTLVANPTIWMRVAWELISTTAP